MNKNTIKVEKYVLSKGMMIGERTAERVVSEMTHFETTKFVDVLGRSTSTGESMTMKITREEFNLIVFDQKNK
jgi:hypothetical protein